MAETITRPGASGKSADARLLDSVPPLVKNNEVSVGVVRQANERSGHAPIPTLGVPLGPADADWAGLAYPVALHSPSAWATSGSMASSSYGPGRWCPGWHGAMWLSYSSLPTAIVRPPRIGRPLVLLPSHGARRSARGPATPRQSPHPRRVLREIGPGPGVCCPIC